MALHLLESFNTYAVKNDLGIKWSDVGYYCDIQLTGGRYGGGCLKTGTVYADVLHYTPPFALPLGATGIIGQAVFVPVDWNSSGTLFEVIGTNDDDPLKPPVTVMRVSLNMTTKQMDVLARSTDGNSEVLVERTANAIQPGRWNFLEFKASCLTGDYTLRVNEEVWATGTADLSGQVLGTTFVAIGVGLPGAMCLQDDIYICDETGPTHNDFLGDITVKVVYPVADVEGEVDFTRSEGAFNYATVDEQQMSTDDWNESSNVGDKDLFEMGDLNITGDVLGVQVVAVARKSGAASRAIRSILKPNLVESEGPDQYLTQDIPNGSLAIYGLNPETSAPWTPEDVNALVCGYRVSI